MDASVPEVTEKELEVLQMLWEHGPSPIRPLTEAVYGDSSSASYGTVQKLLERLEAKGCVTRDRSAMTHIFHPRLSREEYIGGRLRAMADKLCGGSLTPVLTHLLQTETLSAGDRKALRRLLNSTDGS
jgi:predicted transcriptional regulator